MDFFKNETVFSISLILAVISCFFVKPSGNYLSYINWDTIILLFVIMVVVEILKNLAIFEILIRKLLVRIGNTYSLVFILVFIVFFSAIFITNDVSLIIFIPFTILALKKVGRVDLTILTVSLQTIAANIGCMVLPIGAPHNIVMYTVSKIPFGSFFLLLLPYVIISVLFLLVVLFFVPRDDITLPNWSVWLTATPSVWRRRVRCSAHEVGRLPIMWPVCVTFRLAPVMPIVPLLARRLLPGTSFIRSQAQKTRWSSCM